MFRSDDQKIRVFRTLLQRIGKADLWTDSGPAPELIRLADTGRSAMSGGEKTLCLITMALWNGCRQVAFERVDGLDDNALFAVGSLLCALALGSAHVDAWIEEQQLIQARRLAQIDAFINDREATINLISNPFRQS
jgi:hypothetical protein